MTALARSTLMFQLHWHNLWNHIRRSAVVTVQLCGWAI